MRPTIIVSILLSVGLQAQAQLNYEGNPLTETIDYTAQESQSARLNARHDYQRFEVADGRTMNLSRVPYAPTAVDPPTTWKTKHSSYDDNDNETSCEERSEETIEQQMIPTRNGSPLIETDPGSRTSATLAATSEPARNVEHSIEGFPKVSLPKLDIETPAETRQLREYPIQSSHTAVHQSHSSQQMPRAYDQPSLNYVPPKQSVSTGNPSSHLLNQISQASGQALSQFLNSRTPEESQLALESYLRSRAQASSGSIQHPVAINDEQTRQSVEQRAIVRDTLDNEITMNYENANSPKQFNDIQKTPVTVASDSMGQIAYLPRGAHQYPSPRWNQLGVQSRRDGFHPAPSMRRPPFYRVPMRPRLSPWAQSRIAPGPPIYHPKGSLFAGPPVSPATGLNGHWKQPIEVIYTKPPGTLDHGSAAVGNPSGPYEDPTNWLPDSDHQPTQKDVYYSQLYAQSYDPHYYNYIAKTGKIKPWLYGKLGKNEEKSIWWELYSGFKNHGMKNMMNPMFLLGMTIPTLTLMLSALVQKRSMGRADTTGLYDSREFIDKYEPQIRAALLAYGNEANERMKRDTTMQGTSMESMIREIRKQPHFRHPLEAYLLAQSIAYPHMIPIIKKTPIEEFERMRPQWEEVPYMKSTLDRLAELIKPTTETMNEEKREDVFDV